MTLIALLLVLTQAQASPAPSAATAVARLRAKLPVVALTNPSATQLAGHYTSTPKELGEHIGGGFLSGDDLYLFPDGTYIYCEWADVMPTIIVDKGRWTFEDGVVALRSDPDIKWHTRLERYFVAVRRVSHPHEAFLVGIERALAEFEENAKDGPGFMLLVVGKKREQAITPAQTPRLERKLMRESWRPDFYHKD